MFIARDQHTNNVYYIDREDNYVELWDFAGNRKLWRQHRGAQELVEELYAMLRDGWVRRSSDELSSNRP